MLPTSPYRTVNAIDKVIEALFKSIHSVNVGDQLQIASKQMFHCKRETRIYQARTSGDEEGAFSKPAYSLL